ncbi:hypothetical protein [Microbacterium sp.]|uniref:hypothetical protein n=1 Tax=Microbacterium sp. TaxID=51671 RepID=UPI002811EE4F|nr:hypothetical protein [Microbacterium sp.]
MPETAAVADRERDALSRGEQPMLAPDVQRVPVPIQGDRHTPGVADALRGRCDGPRVAVVLSVCGGRLAGARGHHLHDAHAGLPRAEHGFRVGEGSGAQHIHEQVVAELVVGAVVGDEVGGAFAFVGGDEAGSAAAGRRAASRIARHQAAPSSSNRIDPCSTPSWAIQVRKRRRA